MGMLISVIRGYMMIKGKENNDKITSIEEYIERVSSLISNKDNETTVVFRGEDQIYPTPCQPNIFRKNILSRNKYFEKNLFDEMSANDLTNGKTYLERAIDAQHGGFPSRLLDVSYNSLVALYFAVTPETKSKENSNDGINSAVYIYFIKKIFCPSGENINSTYDSIVKRENKWLCEKEIFQRNHKLIDHIRKNKRVIAQQGAFILFQGDSINPIPYYDYKKVIIDGNKKWIIRKNLKELFGIHTGSIYPEAGNLIEDMIDKSMKVATDEFKLNTELARILNTLERELSIYYSKLVQMICDTCDEKEILEEINSIERNIYEYKIELEDLYTFNKFTKEEFQDLNINKKRYNDIIEIFSENISSYIYNIGIEFSKSDLLLGEFIDEQKYFSK
jgi:hypothetical protein